MRLPEEQTRKQYAAPQLTVFGELKGIVKNFTTFTMDETNAPTMDCNAGNDIGKPCVYNT